MVSSIPLYWSGKNSKGRQRTKEHAQEEPATRRALHGLLHLMARRAESAGLIRNISIQRANVDEPRVPGSRDPPGLCPENCRRSGHRSSSTDPKVSTTPSSNGFGFTLISNCKRSGFCYRANHQCANFRRGFCPTAWCFKNSIGPLPGWTVWRYAKQTNCCCYARCITVTPTPLWCSRACSGTSSA